jgi:hypothetical protein
MRVMPKLNSAVWLLARNLISIFFACITGRYNNVNSLCHRASGYRIGPAFSEVGYAYEVTLALRLVSLSRNRVMDGVN